MAVVDGALGWGRGRDLCDFCSFRHCHPCAGRSARILDPWYSRSCFIPLLKDTERDGDDDVSVAVVCVRVVIKQGACRRASFGCSSW